MGAIPRLLRELRSLGPLLLRLAVASARMAAIPAHLGCVVSHPGAVGGTGMVSAAGECPYSNHRGIEQKTNASLSDLTESALSPTKGSTNG